MTGNIESLDDARRAAETAGRRDPRHDAANRYIQRAEEAMALVPLHAATEDRAALYAIAETWLTLAEGALVPSRV